MVSKRLKAKGKSGDTLILDAQGLSLHVDGAEDGHECLVDAIVVATAALCLPPVRLVTSDSSHIPKLCAAALDLPREPTIGLITV